MVFTNRKENSESLNKSNTFSLGLKNAFSLTAMKDSLISETMEENGFH